MASPIFHNVLYPLECLSFQAKRQIAIIIDADPNAFHYLAEFLQFNYTESKAYWHRGLGGPENSATLCLLREYQQRGGTVQYLLWAFEEMRNSAANVIKDCMPDVAMDYQRKIQSRINSNVGQQNSCNLPCCRPPLNHSISNPEQSLPNKNRQARRQSSQPGDYNNREQRSNQNGSFNKTDQSRETVFTRNRRENRQSNSVSDNVQRGATFGRCNCETCRLRSDPNETQLLTPYNEEKGPCLLSQMECLDLNSHSRAPIDDIYALSKSLNGYDLKTKKVCSSSRQGVHYIGDRVEECGICSRYKTGRKSWNGNDSPIDRQRNRHSDSSINCPESSEVIYRRENFDSLRPMNASRNDLNGQQNIPISQSMNDSGSNKTAAVTDDQIHSAGNCDQIHSAGNGDQIHSANNGDQIHSADNGASITHSKNEENDEPPQPRDPVNVDRRPIVFMTYSNHDPRHLNEIREMVKRLTVAGIRVKIDMNPECFDELGVNRNEWLDRSVDRARYVIICISPTYKEDVQGEQNPNDPSPQISQLNARYIYDRLRTEYINNQSQNRRMIPVLFPHSGAEYESHVPQMMQATLVYTFPAQVHMILDRILGRDRQLPYV